MCIVCLVFLAITWCVLCFTIEVVLETPPTPTGCVSTEESNPLTETESEVEKKGFDIEGKLEINMGKLI